MNKHVLTGGPCSGKTTLIDMLFDNGYRVVPETARFIIELEKIHEDGILPWKPGKMEQFQELVFYAQKTFEDIFSRKFLHQSIDNIIFLDRSLVDPIAYCKVYGVKEPTGLREAIEAANYQTVFFLEQVPYDRDMERKEAEEMALRLSDALYEAYYSLGYKIIRLPDMGHVKERHSMIINYLKG